LDAAINEGAEQSIASTGGVVAGALRAESIAVRLLIGLSFLG
jgi:hypothetical protein